MTELCFVDTNVLVYARDRTEPEKQHRAEEWMQTLWRTRQGRLSIQVLQEYYAVVVHKLRPGLKKEAAREDVRALMTWQPVPISPAVIERAWTIQDRYKYAWWDALITAAAHGASCRYLLTEDLQVGQQVDGLEIVNPFRTAPETIYAGEE